MTVSELVDLLIETHTSNKRKRPLIVAIDGLSGAGKTTLVKRLDHELSAKKINVVAIHIDDHIVTRSDRYETGHEEWYEYYSLQWDVELLRDVLFNRLHQNDERLTLPFYDSTTDCIVSKDIVVAENSIVLIDGVFLQRKEWKRYFDLKVYLDCPVEERYHRVLGRNDYTEDSQERLAKYQRRYWPGEEHYLATEQPQLTAEVVLSSKALEFKDE